MCQTAIKRLHPDFEYRFYTDEDIARLMKTEFPEETIITPLNI